MDHNFVKQMVDQIVLITSRLINKQLIDESKKFVVAKLRIKFKHNDELIVDCV